MPRVLYVFGNAGKKPGSVQIKVTSQIEALNGAGVSCEGAFFTGHTEFEEDISETIKLIPVKPSRSKLFINLSKRRGMLRAMCQYIKENHRDYDLIYMRYAGAQYSLYNILNEIGCKVGIEHNSKEILEIWSLRKNFKPYWKLSSILGLVSYVVIPVIQELTMGVLVRRNVLFATCVSNDMGRYQKRLSLGKLRYYPIGNGIKVDQNPMRSCPVFDGTSLDILFLKGSSGNSPWNGLDRLLEGMAIYKGQCNIRLYVVGHFIKDEFKIPESIQNNVHVTGFLEGSELDNIFNKCHVACGTLSLYLSGQVENATLKVRNYIARGIPFFYAYEDVDLKGKPGVERWSLEMENNANPVVMEAVIGFAHRALYEGHEKAMREFAIEYLDYNVKMTNLAEILIRELEGLPIQNKGR